MILATLDFQTVSDAVGLGAIYALMAVGIGLVFGVLRLVNFAYGQLVMAGAFTIAFLLQAIALIVDLRDDTLGEVAASLTSLNAPVSIAGGEIRKITLVTIGVAAA